MPFQPPKEQPDFGRLLAVINTSASSFKDKALWQILVGLLKKIAQFQSITVADIADIINQIEAADTNIVNILNTLADATFLTKDDETADLASAIQLLAGANVSFDDTVPNQRTINVAGSELPVGSVFSTYINVNAGTLLGYGTWLLFATGVKDPSADITFTVY